MATLLDVAKKALVFLAMDELDYRPNNAANALAQNRTLVVKVMIVEEMDTAGSFAIGQTGS